MATDILRPDADVSVTGWDSPVFSQINDVVTTADAPNITSGAQYTASQTTGHVFEVSFPDLNIGSDDVSSVVAYLYGREGNSGTVTIEIYKTSTQIATGTLGNGGSAGWGSVTYNGDLSQAEVNDLRVRVTLTTAGSTNSRLGALYIEVTHAAPSGTPHTVDPADSVTLSDAVSFSRSIVLADTVGLADSLSRQIDAARAFDDTVGLSDNAATSVDKVRQFDDTVGLSDLADPQLSAGTIDHTVTPSDTVSLADAVAMDRGVAISDTISLSDSITVNRGLSLADSLTLADQMLSSKQISLSPADSVILSDNAITETGKGVSVDDSITVSDNVIFDRAMAFAEALSLADAIAKDHGITIEDVIAIADLADPVNETPAGVEHELNFDDSITVSDALSFIRELTRNEVLPVSDSHTRTFNGVILSDGQEARVYRGTIVIGRF